MQNLSNFVLEKQNQAPRLMFFEDLRRLLLSMSLRLLMMQLNILIVYQITLCNIFYLCSKLKEI